MINVIHDRQILCPFPIKYLTYIQTFVILKNSLTNALIGVAYEEFAPSFELSEKGRSTFSSTVQHLTNIHSQKVIMSVTTTGNLGPMILQSLAPAMLYVPTPTMNYITICDKVSMPANGGTTCRFMRPRALTPPTIQLGNSGIDPPAQIPQRDIIDAQMAFFGRLQVADNQLIAA